MYQKWNRTSPKPAGTPGSKELQRGYGSLLCISQKNITKCVYISVCLKVVLKNSLSTFRDMNLFRSNFHVRFFNLTLSDGTKFACNSPVFVCQDPSQPGQLFAGKSFMIVGFAEEDYAVLRRYVTHINT